MEYQYIKYERYNMLINDQMAGDGIINYHYNEQHQLSKIDVELVPYPSVFSGYQNDLIDKNWPGKIEVKTLNTTSADALNTLLKQMVKSTKAAELAPTFQLRRSALAFGFDKNGKQHDFYLITESAPFPPTKEYIKSKIVQPQTLGEMSYHNSESSIEEVINQVKELTK